MKKTITSLLLVWAIGSCGTSFLQAQTAVEKGLKSINRPSAEAIVGFLADDALQGREAGMIGSRVAARYLVSCLQEAGIAPLYDDSYYQPFEACAKERQQKGRWQVHPRFHCPVEAGHTPLAPHGQCVGHDSGRTDQ